MAAESMINPSTAVNSAFELRRTHLLRQSVEDGDRRYREDLRLVYYEDERPRHRGGHVAQESLGYAAALLSLRQNTTRARGIIQEVLRHQCMEKADRCYGGFFWFSGQEEVIDHNAVSFVVPWLGWLIRHQSAQLGDSLCAAIRRSMKLSLNALLAHPAAWAYTNVYLLNIAAKCAVAEACDDPRAAQITGEEWREWRACTNRFGIIEYLSPTYTAVQIEALELMLDSTASTAIAAEVQSVLDLYWKDLLLSFHRASGRFVGTFSRGKPEEYLADRSPLNLLAFLHLDAPCGGLGCYNATHALAAREISSCLLDRLSIPSPRTLRRTLPMHGIERHCHLTDDWGLAMQTGDFGLETPVFAAWNGGGFFHKTPAREHENFGCQREGQAIFVERWWDRAASVCSRWCLFDSQGGPAPTIRESSQQYLLADVPIAGGHLAMEFLAPHGFRIERANRMWTLCADVPGLCPASPLVAMSLAFAARPTKPERSLFLEECSHGWTLRAQSMEVQVPRKSRMLYEGSGWNVSPGHFLDPIRKV